jgi:hypothetical protein
MCGRLSSAIRGICVIEQRGYWIEYSDDVTTSRFENGEIVQRTEPSPPWLIVDQRIWTVIVTRWPVRLWQAEVLVLGDMSGLVVAPGYWRATRIKLLNEVPSFELFGEQGRQFVEFLDFVKRIETNDARALLQHDRYKLTADAASDGYASAWQKWVQSKEPSDQSVAREWAGTLAAPRLGRKLQSPVVGGFMLLHNEIRRRAVSVEGATAMIVTIDEDGDTDQTLAPHWKACSSSLLNASMALCAPTLVTEEQREAMLVGWQLLQQRVDK